MAARTALTSVSRALSRISSMALVKTAKAAEGDCVDLHICDFQKVEHNAGRQSLSAQTPLDKRVVARREFEKCKD
ncbi:protein of unknown function (plasmid) [Cupriavidus neocaledonicus]|uniref:Uncharacterized protein n=1 Tax=Cupriavidus neocaledonicus TaxID=1040979 RepID=A0A375HSH1_9BURK|nr:protein of unknown function [Cupriavidus neocaledonicus]